MNTRFINNSTTYVFIVLLVAYICFIPGLEHVFILDDFNTLSPLAAFGSSLSWEEVNEYIFGGSTGPTGRPISLLSFVLNSDAWPSEPATFIKMNIFIHLMNGLLLFLFLRNLFLYVGVNKSQSILTAFFVFLIWVLHPSHVSSVLYIVQRMTLLSTFFCLLTFIIFMRLRLQLGDKKKIFSTTSLLLGGVSASLLALMSKENAVLIPAQLLIIECYLLLNNVKLNATRTIRFGYYFSLVFCTAIYFIYLFSLPVRDIIEYLSSNTVPMHDRTFNMFERVLTEQRIVGDYLLNILLPKVQNAGVFHDNYEISNDLLDPISTIGWLLVHLLILVIAFLHRKKNQLIFFGIFFFYLSHSLESSFLMLELKFDHRNYLPSIGLVIALVGIVEVIFRSVHWRPSFSLGILAIVNLGCLVSASSLWGQPEKASMVWIKENPQSIRALEHAATIKFNRGDIDAALKFLSESIALSGGSPTSELKYMVSACRPYNGTGVDWEKFAERLRREDRNWALDSVLSSLLDIEIENNCLGFNFENYQSLLRAYRENTAYSKLFTAVLLDVSEIKAAYHFKRTELIPVLINQRDIRRVPLAFEMLKAGVVASSGDLSLARQRLSSAIDIAESDQGYYAEDEFNISSAKEMLSLIDREINK